MDLVRSSIDASKTIVKQSIKIGLSSALISVALAALCCGTLAIGMACYKGIDAAEHYNETTEDIDETTEDIMILSVTLTSLIAWISMVILTLYAVRKTMKIIQKI